ncbi:MAG: glycosyltransferase family 2 protein [Bacteroidota bacterium]
MPRLSILIPTYHRPQLLPRAIASALAQTETDIEVIVVEDGSPEPAVLPDDPRVRRVRLEKNVGVSGARNTGAESATSRYITYLDDDDELLPHFTQTALDALAETTLPKPVAALSGMDVVQGNGKLVETRIPPTLPRGSHFQLEPIDPEYSYFSKQTLVVERDLLLRIGGYDRGMASRVLTDLMLRLSPVCSILGIPTVGYRHYVHGGDRISDDPGRRKRMVEYLIAKHDAALREHPEGFSTFLIQHAITLWSLGERGDAVQSALRAARVSPVHTSALLASTMLRGVRHSISVSRP